MKPYSRFGSLFYKVDYKLPVLAFSSLALFDSLKGGMHYSKSAGCHFSAEGQHILMSRTLPPRTKTFFYRREKSLQALALAIVITSRTLPEPDRLRILSATSIDDMNILLHALFNPIIRVPKMLCVTAGSYTTYSAK